MMKPAIEFWFEFGSNYSYLSVMRIEQEAAQRGVRVIWKPFLLGPIFKALGWETSPFVLQKEKGRYVWKDMQRQCARYGLPWTQPSVFPRRALLPLRVALVSAEEAWMGEYCRRMMLMNFAEDRDIDNEAAVRGVLRALDVPSDAVLEQAQGEANKAWLRERTQAARELGIFGAPTFFVRGEMFWGNDRLEQALDFAAEQG